MLVGLGNDGSRGLFIDSDQSSAGVRGEGGAGGRSSEQTVTEVPTLPRTSFPHNGEISPASRIQGPVVRPGWLPRRQTTTLLVIHYSI